MQTFDSQAKEKLRLLVSAANCPNHLAFENAEKLAIASKTGVWSQPRLEKPYR
ncbi:MAG: hypothetical protein ACYT04_37605 [Nostoc sp.]